MTASHYSATARMACQVESAMAELAVDGAASGISAAGVQEKPETTEAVVDQQTTPGKSDAPEPTDTAEKAKKQRRRRGKKPAAAADKEADENAAPAGPVDVAAVLKARAAAKKGGRKGKPASAAAQAALANAKARPQKKSGAKGGRSEGGPRAAKTGKSQNDKCLP